MSKIALVGPMGAGKSTIGRLLAGILRAPFYDSDHVIEEKTGADIPWIFDVEGEEGFRDRETAALVSLLEIDVLVLATGGGIVLREKNRQLLKCADAVIYLKADTERLVQRTMKDKNRPLLQVDDPRKKIVELLEERDPLYREVATHVILTDSRSPKMIAQQVAARLTAEP
jgi:shikimate kinase